MKPSLSITLGTDLTAPSAAHSLLVAFQFGSNQSSPDHPAIVDTHLNPIDCDLLYECWWVEDEVEFESIGSIKVARCAEYAFFTYENDCADCDDYEELTLSAYRELIRTVQSSSYPKIAKIWNYLGDINEGEGDMERYRLFSSGRASAFDEMALPDELSPTGTGVGTQNAHGLTIIALCSGNNVSLAENPRQMSAFQYPRQYGPRSPKFGRGGLVLTENHDLYLLSGTASIVGHESLHAEDTTAQFDETLLNLEAVFDAISESCDDRPKVVLDEQCVLRVYLRDIDDYLKIAALLKARLGPAADQVAFLHGDICRRELLIEIDGVRIR